MSYPSNYEACRDWIWAGFDGQKNDQAPGESFATAYGVTEYTWGYAIAQGVVPDKPISQATKADCDTVLRALFWNAAHCSSLPPGVNLMVFNDAVLSGVGHAVRLLQRILGTTQDGAVGQITTRLANSFGDRALMMAIEKADEEYLGSLAKAPLYGAGWLRRERECYALALQMGGLGAQN